MIAKEYKDFCADLVRNFDKDWAKVGLKVDFGYQFLEHVPLNAWHPMVTLAVDHWEGWPRNWVRAVKEICQLWKAQEHIERSVTDCEKCNGNGFFSGTKMVEVKPGIFVSYRHTWRCAACRNWFGVMGEKIPAGYPLEIKSQGFEIDIYQKPMPRDQRSFDLTQIIDMAGHRVNQKTDRPDYLPYREFGD